MKYFAFFFIVILFSCTENQPKYPAVSESMKSFIDAGDMTGSVTLVVTKDEILHMDAQGFADIEKTKKIEADALFWIASMSKPVTGAALMILHDDGKLSVEDPVSKYIPAFASLKTPSGKPANITIKQLMDHTSGLGEGDSKALMNTKTLEELIPIYLASPMSNEPGERWLYCQSGINTAARVVEVVSEMPFDRFLEERLFKPLGMEHTTFYPGKIQSSVRVKGYTKNENSGQMELVPFSSPLYDGSESRPPLGNGGLYSTGPDYSRFCQMLLGEGRYQGKRILSNEAVKIMTTIHTGDLPTGFLQSPALGNHGKDYGYGIGTCILRSTHEGVAEVLSPGTFGHGGAWGTQAWMDPARGIAYVLMVQRPNFNADASEIRRVFQQKAFQTFLKSKGEVQTTTEFREEIPLKKKSLASKPPMGWNSYDCFGLAVNESEVRANAEFMAKNLKQLGYEYIVPDMLWYGDYKASDYNAFTHDTIPEKPNYTLDEFGRYLPDTIKFPSAKNGAGFKPLADYIHSLGLKFGIHIIRGIPWQAAEKDLKIKDTSIGARSIAQPDKGCEWYDGFYGIDMTKPGGQEYYDSMFELFALWGVDFVKADDMQEADLIAVGKAARTCGRDIVISNVGSSIPMNVQKENAHMSRLGADFWDVWEMLKRGFQMSARAVTDTEEGFWPDLDMLPVGKLGLKITYKGPGPRISNFTKDELYTLFSLWYITRQPLMLGGHLPQTDKQTLDLIKNTEALEVNRNSMNNRQIKFKNAIIIWAADIPDSDDKYVALFHQWESFDPVTIDLTWDEIGLDPQGEYKVRDLWAKKDLGSFKSGFGLPVQPHGARLLKISK